VPRQAQTLNLSLDGRAVAVSVRRSARARRVAIRVDPALGGAELILPQRAAESEGVAFLHSRAAWLLRRLDALPPRIPFHDGAIVPLRGAPHRIAHDAAARRGVWAADGRIVVSGRAEHLPRRVGDWLRRQARAAIAPLVAEKATTFAAETRTRHPGRISIRDQRSRWGSCAANGNLSFSWRLILAPDTVLDYVVAHEIGHLAHPNHSPAFWAGVDRLTPHAQRGRRWLRRNGATLFRYG